MSFTVHIEDIWILPPVKPFWQVSNQSSLPSHVPLVMEKAGHFQPVWCCSRQILDSMSHVPPKRTAWTDGVATAQGIKDHKMLPQYLPPESSGTVVMTLKGGRVWGQVIPDSFQTSQHSRNDIAYRGAAGYHLTDDAIPYTSRRWNTFLTAVRNYKTHNNPPSFSTFSDILDI